MSTKTDNAKALYIEGIQKGQAKEAVAAYTGERYTQHSTGVRDGADGFVEFFGAFLERNPIRDIHILRAIEDGQFVFLHASQSLNNGESRWITMDMFDTDDHDRIVEHWDVITEWVDSATSGHSQIDGPTEVTDLDQTAANKALVTAFVNEVLVTGRADEVGKYVSTQTYIEHSPQAAAGTDGLSASAAQVGAASTPLVYKYVHKILAQGNFVVTYCLTQLGAEDLAVFDLYRIEDGLIVEHWNAMEPLPRGDMLVNQGKF
ncbi:MAG: nuclear transport factor 2 family protein [Actinomycetia bacterium]|nr:nuclear transport factor 2 family protein [Actinomycetes bacterium]